MKIHRSMSLPLLLVWGGLLGGTGCIEMTHELRIGRDGAAVYQLQYAITETAISQFKALETLARDMALAEGRSAGGLTLDPLLRVFLDPRDDALTAALEPYREAGLVIDELRVRSREARRQVDLRVSVRDLRLLEDTGFFQAHGFELRHEGEGRYSFRRRPVIDEALWAGIDVDAESRRQLEPLLGGFRCAVNVTVPGRITSSTSHRTRLQTATWEYDFATMPDVLLRLQKQAFRVVFEGVERPLPEISYDGPPAR